MTPWPWNELESLSLESLEATEASWLPSFASRPPKVQPRETMAKWDAAAMERGVETLCEMKLAAIAPAMSQQVHSGTGFRIFRTRSTDECGCRLLHHTFFLLPPTRCWGEQVVCVALSPTAQDSLPWLCAKATADRFACSNCGTRTLAANFDADSRGRPNCFSIVGRVSAQSTFTTGRA